MLEGIELPVRRQRTSATRDLGRTVAAVARRLRRTGLIVRVRCTEVWTDDVTAAGLFGILSSLTARAVHAMNGCGVLEIEAIRADARLLLFVRHDGPTTAMSLVGRRAVPPAGREADIGTAERLAHEIGASVRMVYTGQDGGCVGVAAPLSTA